MLGDEVAGQIVNAAAMKFRFAKVSAKKRLVIVPRHEANSWLSTLSATFRPSERDLAVSGLVHPSR